MKGVIISMERLQKVIAQTGYCSRRKAEELIKSGKVEVNGKVITEMGVKVNFDDDITVEGNGLNLKEEKWVYKFKDNRISSATLTSTITAGGDYSQYIEDYKTDAEKAADSYKKVNGVSAKVSQKSNKVSITVKFDTSKMDEADIDAYNLNESSESIEVVLEGYTCK